MLSYSCFEWVGVSGTREKRGSWGAPPSVSAELRVGKHWVEGEEANGFVLTVSAPFRTHSAHVVCQRRCIRIPDLCFCRVSMLPEVCGRIGHKHACFAGINCTLV